MRLADYKTIVVLTGAGISRGAGLATYRGPGGLWSDPKLAALAHVDALHAQRAEVCAMFWKFRSAVQAVEPTAAHRALAAFEATGANILIVTQNIDGLHQRAGSKNVVEYHGSLARWRCEVCTRELEPPDGEPPACCGQIMRPSIVMFGEQIPVAAEHTVKRALRDVDLFVAIGTSGTVAPASSFVSSAAYAGARRVLLNLEYVPGAHELFDEIQLGEADALVTAMFA